MKHRVLILATSPKTKGGISSVIEVYRHSGLWSEFSCRWISTHRDGSAALKLLYLCCGFIRFLFCLPFYHIVHVHLSLPVSLRRKALFVNIASFCGKKVIVHLHCGTDISAIWNRAYEKVFCKADKVLVLSEQIRKDVLGCIGDSFSSRIQVLPNPCPQVIPSGQPKEDLIIFTGLIVEGKGYRDLINAFSRIALANPSWKLVIAGDGEVARAKELAATLGITGKVQFPGWISGKAKDELFRNAAVFCLPSYGEGLPMSVLEAMAHRDAIVTTPVGGIPDFLKDGELALFCNPGDIDTLASCLERLIADKELRERIADNAANYAAEHFASDVICNQLKEIYNGL